MSSLNHYEVPCMRGRMQRASFPSLIGYARSKNLPEPIYAPALLLNHNDLQFHCLASFPTEQAEPVETSKPSLSSFPTQRRFSKSGNNTIDVFQSLFLPEPKICDIRDSCQYSLIKFISPQSTAIHFSNSFLASLNATNMDAIAG